MTVYRVTPLHKKSVVARYEMYRENADGTVSWFTVHETWRWGQGFIDSELDCNLPYDGDDVAYCDATVGWGCELDDLCACWFEFSEDMDEQEKEEIEELYNEGGAGWLYDGDHDWLEEDSGIEVLAPFQIDLCEEDATIVEENVKLKTRPNPNTSWPFSEAFPKPTEE